MLGVYKSQAYRYRTANLDRFLDNRAFASWLNSKIKPNQQPNGIFIPIAGMNLDLSWCAIDRTCWARVIANDCVLDSLGLR